MINYLFTVFTPTYNRAESIHRVYESLRAQTVRDFEWIVVDDGSEDNTAQLVCKWSQQSNFPIMYIYQNHSGKHIAWNKAVRQARGKFFVIADSDDSFKPNSLERMQQMWESIPLGERESYRGITCRCIDNDGQIVGTVSVPVPWLDASELDAKYKYHLQYEMWGMNRTDVMRKYPNPEIKGLRFFPESIIWDEMGKKYLTRYFNEPLRIVYHDQKNATTVKAVNNRYRENYYLWHHILNDLGVYLKDNPKLIIKSAIGIVRDGILAKRSYFTIIKEIRDLRWKAVAVVTSPIAVLLVLNSYRVTK